MTVSFTNIPKVEYHLSCIHFLIKHDHMYAATYKALAYVKGSKVITD